MHAVKAQAAQFKTQSGKELSFDQYTLLLISAAQQYDRTLLQSGPITRSRGIRHVYTHELDEMYHDDFHDAEQFDIDSTIDQIEVYTANRAPRGPRLTRDQWYSLPDDAKCIWDTLLPEAKAIILNAPNQSSVTNGASQASQVCCSMPPRPLPSHTPACQLNLHDLDTLITSLHELCVGSHDVSVNEANVQSSPPSMDPSHAHVTSVNEASTVPSDNIADSNELLAYLANRKALPGDIKRLMSKSNNTREASMANIVYNVSSYRTAVRRGALIDHGANGGIAGDDIHVIEGSSIDKFVDIQGIDNHCMVDIPIVSCGGVVQSQKGPIIAILHQFAHTGKGKTIISPAQLESFNQTVYDKSRKVVLEASRGSKL